MARLQRVLSPRTTIVLRAACAAVLAALLSACRDSSAAKRDDVVLASVNGDEITTGDLQVSTDALSGDKAAVIESLIDEKLLAQKAVASHLDRDPGVALQIEHARRQILAHAYEERSVSPRSQVSLAAEREYYRSNAALFAQRRIYRTLTFSIARSRLTPILKKELDHVRSALHIRELLDRHRIAFEAVETTRAAEEIPADILRQLLRASMSDVLIASLPQESHALLICIVAVEDRPLDFEHARASIKQYLTDARNREALEQYLRQARSLASISYGESSYGAPIAAADAAIQKESSFE